jgi:hypothetical protein
MVSLLEISIKTPDNKPLLYEVGQAVRVLKGLSQDGQTPKFWDGAIAKVISRGSSPVMKIHSYRLQHPNGAIDDFREEELDRRYARNKEKIEAEFNTYR